MWHVAVAEVDTVQRARFESDDHIQPPMPAQHPNNKRRNSYKGASGTSGSRLTDIHPQDVMSTEMRLRWNIRVLQRHDPAIHSIVDQFTYAVLYRYDDDRWVKRGVEGSMFIYTRCVCSLRTDEDMR